ncbi:MAG: ChaN family lipoprotein [Bacteroidota bacterium]|nr:ChaN family lipoprotein [Bacteroidota bacterium]
MKKILFCSAIAFISFGFAGEKKAYEIFTGEGNTSSYAEMLNAVKDADIVLFGELHDNPIVHWLELELTKDLYTTKNNKLVLGAEMFEADDQVTLNEYLAGKLSEGTFKAEAKLWGNYETDYKPLVDFAKTNHLAFIAANIPRRYANLVYKRGLRSLDSLSPEAKKFIAPLPITYDSTVQAYKEIFENGGGHGGQNLPMSQASKDATMAYFILQNWKPGQLFLHYNGAYHSNNHSGIAWYLLKSNPKLKIVVISAATQENIEKLDDENKKLGEFIITVPESMTRTKQ